MVDVHISKQPDLDNASPGTLYCEEYMLVFKSTGQASFELNYDLIDVCELGSDERLLRLKCKDLRRYVRA